MRPPAGRVRRGFVLPVVLLVLVLIALLAASFSFEMNADLAVTRGALHRFQTRQAADAGIQRVMLLLRERRLETDAWYNNPDELRRVLVWRGDLEPTDLGQPDATEVENDRRPAFLFSIVADDPANDEIEVRYGLTNEAARLNINTASRDQLRTLIAQVFPEAPVEEMADALMDWRDEDDAPGEHGAESAYYATLDPPYRPKNAPFDTVEELLMVRGFTAQILYGEDYDRNGLLSPNENDGELSFPLDDGDGELNRGLYPYVTVYSRDFNTANDNKPRFYIGKGIDGVREDLAEFFSDEELDFIAAALAADYSEEANSNGAGGGASTSQPTRGGSRNQMTEMYSLVDLLKPVPQGGGQWLPSPFTLEDFHRILDRLSLWIQPEQVGLVDVNTAPAEVLRCVPFLTAQMVDDIVAQRAALDSTAKRTPAWLLIHNVVDEGTMAEVIPFVTARGFQFEVESVGFATHVGTVSRIQAVLQMRGPVAQIVYYRDLTPLGIGYPLRLEDERKGGQPGVASAR
ncbi:MAG: general secretion pathway protein GspK [Phycisphaerae bacterium]|nr:general secretion pathway protein GspK [Phycisphaerae bacterium]